MSNQIMFPTFINLKMIAGLQTLVRVTTCQETKASMFINLKPISGMIKVGLPDGMFWKCETKF